MKTSGFLISYTITNITSIRPISSIEKDGILYPSSVKFRSSLFETRDDEELGQVEREVHVEFIIPCPHEDLKQFNVWLRHYMGKGNTLTIKGTFPISGSSKTMLVVLSHQTATEILENAKTKNKNQS